LSVLSWTTEPDVLVTHGEALMLEIDLKQLNNNVSYQFVICEAILDGDNLMFFINSDITSGNSMLQPYFICHQI